MVRTALATTALTTALLLAAPASAQDSFGGIEKVLRPAEPIGFVVDGLNSDEERLRSPAERDLDNSRIYDNGAVFEKDFGGDTHRARASRSGGSILNIFKLFDGGEETR